MYYEPTMTPLPPKISFTVADPEPPSTPPNPTTNRVLLSNILLSPYLYISPYQLFTVEYPHPTSIYLKVSKRTAHFSHDINLSDPAVSHLFSNTAALLPQPLTNCVPLGHLLYNHCILKIIPVRDTSPTPLRPFPRTVTYLPLHGTSNFTVAYGGSFRHFNEHILSFAKLKVIGLSTSISFSPYHYPAARLPIEYYGCPTTHIYIYTFINTDYSYRQAQLSLQYSYASTPYIIYIHHSNVFVSMWCHYKYN